MSRKIEPTAPEALQIPDRHYVQALHKAVEVVEQKDRSGATYSWLLLPSRNTWPTRHIDRPVPTPGCGCAPCRRPRCCGSWAEPVELIVTGEVVAWVCSRCLEAVA